MDENTRINDIQTEICVLMNQLSSNTSPIGDWKISKIYEYRLQNKEDPYDMQELCNARQAVRDRINELQKELSVIKSTVTNA